MDHAVSGEGEDELCLQVVAGEAEPVVAFFSNLAC